MKLMYKINLVTLSVLVALGVCITVAGFTTISQVIYELNREVMSREVDNIVGGIESAFSVLARNHLENVESYKRQAQLDVVAELQNYQYGDTGKLIIVTGDGRVVRNPMLQSGQPAGIDHVAEMVSRQAGSMEFPLDGREHFFSFKVFPTWDWLIILCVDSDELLAARTRFLVRGVLILVAGLIIGTLIFVGFTGRVVGPVRQLATATTYVSKGKWDAPLPKPAGNDEVAQLTVAFRKMSKRLAEMYGSLQQKLQEIEQSRIALRESEEKYRGLVELLPLAVFETDARGRLVFANRNAFETFGYTGEDLIKGISISDMVDSADRKRVVENMARIFKGEDPGMMEYNGLRKDNCTFSCIALASPIFHGAKPAGIRGIFMDITERKNLENKLRRAQQFLSSIINNMADPIFVKNDKYQWILTNAAYCELNGNTHQEIIGKTNWDLYSPSVAEKFCRRDDAVFSAGTALETEDEVTTASGHKRFMLTKATAFTAEDGLSYLVGIVKDITERKQMEQDLLKTQKLESVGILAGGIAHDFNNILTALLGNLTLAKLHSIKDSEIYRHLVKTEHASKRAKDLTQQLLTFSRGGAPIKQTISLAGLIEESAAFALRGSNVRYEVSIPDTLWTVEVDEDQVSRVIHNLVVNASQSMPRGGVVRLAAENMQVDQHTAAALSPGRYVRLNIIDQGSGISDEHLTKIFDPYFTTKDKGSGLGLATAYSIVKRHDGLLSVSSDLNVGSTFHLDLPASDKTIAAPSKESDMIERGRGEILVMDDEEMVREIVGDILRYLGYTATFAGDGDEAISKYRKRLAAGKAFDAVIMDLTIPGGIGGKEAVKLLLDVDPNAKTIVASGYSKDPVMANYSRYGFSGVIAKPFSISILGKVLHTLLHEPSP